ncbi:MAG: XTP/dITP diphosphatase [Nitrospirae bacterium]|nr:XTP/dITP diphosphatase [Nitrospirota bacterium]
MEIVFATRNKKKAEEMHRILNGMDMSILTLNDFTGCSEVAEDSDTFEGNAVKKAAAAAKCTNRISVADDSGIEVYALKNAPGVTSARYAGKDATDAENLNKLLSEMKGIPEEKRGARFVCCIALAFPDGNVKTFFGFVEGRIAKKPLGRKGFGYDPVFYPLGHDRTFAEMSSKEKDALSHRGEALKKFRDYIKESSKSNIKSIHKN